MTKKLTITFLSAAIMCLTLQGQNLITNPSGELGASTGWTIITEGSQGSSCYNNSDWRIQGGQSGFPSAQDGSYYFYCGCANYTSSSSLEGEIYQDIDVSAYSTQIDAGTAPFTFSAYLQTWSNGGGDDLGRFTVEYRNASDTVLSFYDSGIQTSVDSWTLYTDTRNAPSGTRTIRIILRSYLEQQSSVDAYFDNLSLTTSVEIPVGVSFKEALEDVGEFYPNPSKSGLVNLNYTTQNDDEIRVSVFDMTGKLVVNEIKQVSSVDNNLSFDFSDLNTGIYIVKIGDERNPIHRKLIVER